MANEFRRNLLLVTGKLDPYGLFQRSPVTDEEIEDSTVPYPVDLASADGFHSIDDLDFSSNSRGCYVVVALEGTSLKIMGPIKYFRWLIALSIQEGTLPI